MRHRNRVIAALTFTTLTVLACGGSQTPPHSGPVSDFSAPTSASASRPTIAAGACESNGGMVVGDIGDGAIHRPEYRCANGALPTANIAQDPGGPISIEGSVCCPLS